MAKFPWATKGRVFFVFLFFGQIVFKIKLCCACFHWQFRRILEVTLGALPWGEGGENYETMP
jgi:hypothetical protein